MNKVKLSVIVLSVLFSVSALAERNIAYDYGTVIDSVPIVKHTRVSSPREECWNEQVAYRNRGNDSSVSTVLGAVIGGAIGNAVGHKKKNKQVGTAVGAVLGGSIGSSMGKGRTSTVRLGTEEVCRVVHDYRDEERVVGYRVRYRYNNVTYNTRTAREPGDSIKLRLVLSPVN